MGGFATSSVIVLVSNEAAPQISTPASATPNPASVNQTVTLSVAATDLDNNTLSYLWDAGDGTQGLSGATVTHAYTTAGSYTAQVSVSDGMGGFATSSVIVLVSNEAAPQISTPAAATPNPASINQTVTLSVAATDLENNTLSYLWDAGDGTQGLSGATVTHAYTTAGSYMAQVSVSDGMGGFATSSIIVLVSNQAAPQISTPASATPNPAGINQAVTLSVTATNANNISYLWDAGDGTQGLSGATVTHAYTTAGSYKAQVSVSDGIGGFATSSVMVLVSSGAGPITPVITSPLTATASDGASFSYQITASGTQGITYAASGLPAGLSLTGDTISGTPSVSGPFTVTITATNSAGTDTQTLQLVVSAPQSFQIQKTAIKFNFAKPRNGDSMSFQGTLPLASGFAPSGKNLTVSVGGYGSSFTLSPKGSATSGKTDSFKFTGKLTSGAYTSTPVPFQYAVKNQTLFARLSNLGFTNGNVTANISVPVFINAAGTLYEGTASVTYTAKQGKGGSAK
jgi:PKD repeat protein